MRSTFTGPSAAVASLGTHQVKRAEVAKKPSDLKNLLITVPSRAFKADRRLEEGKVPEVPASRHSLIVEQVKSVRPYQFRQGCPVDCSDRLLALPRMSRRTDSRSAAVVLRCRPCLSS